MKRRDALFVLRRLGEGFDPRNGAELPPDGLWSSPEVLRALFVAVEALREDEQGTRDEQDKRHEQDKRDEQDEPEPMSTRRELPENAGKAWSADEDAELRAEFETQKNPGALAAIHGRTRNAILSRLVRLGLVPPRERQVRATEVVDVISSSPSASAERDDAV